MFCFTFQLYVMAIVVINVIVFFLLIKHWSEKKEIECTQI